MTAFTSASLDIDANRKPIYGRDVFLVSNSVTFAAGTTGSVAAHTIFTLTGSVVMSQLNYVINNTVTSGGLATISIGTVTQPVAMGNLLDFNTFIAGGVGTDGAAPGTGVAENSIGSGIFIYNDNIIYTVGTATLTAGKLTFYVLYRPLSSDGNVVAV